MLQNECTRRKVKCLTWRIDGWLGVAIISAGQGKLTLKNILQSQAERYFIKWWVLKQQEKTKV